MTLFFVKSILYLMGTNKKMIRCFMYVCIFTIRNTKTRYEKYRRKTCHRKDFQTKALSHKFEVRTALRNSSRRYIFIQTLIKMRETNVIATTSHVLNTTVLPYSVDAVLLDVHAPRLFPGQLQGRTSVEASPRNRFRNHTPNDTPGVLDGRAQSVRKQSM